MCKNLLNILFSKNCNSGSPNARILVIDDGELERRFMLGALQKAGYTVLEKSDGASGLEAAVSWKPDLIILDYIMPKMDGNEVCRKLKSDGVTRDIPVIFLTGSVKPETVITCYDVGADQYLSKPINASTLLEQVSATLKENAAAK